MHGLVGRLLPAMITGVLGSSVKWMGWFCAREMGSCIGFYTQQCYLLRNDFRGGKKNE